MADQPPYVWENIWRSDVYNDPGERLRRAQRRLTALRELTGTTRALRDVVEFGCGEGSLARGIADPAWGVRSYRGIDRSETAIHRATSLTPAPDKFAFTRSDVFDADVAPNSADTVIACGLLEHLPRAREALEKFHATCRPDALLILTMSNVFSAMYFNRNVRQAVGRWPYGYQRNYSPSRLRGLLSEFFSVEKLTVAQGDSDHPIATAFDMAGRRVSGLVGRYLHVIATPKGKP